MELKNWTDEQIMDWVNGIKQSLLAQGGDYLKMSPQQLDEAVLDGVFCGFENGELRRTDLARIATLMGFEVDEDFMNDPHLDPIDEKNK